MKQGASEAEIRAAIDDDLCGELAPAMAHLTAAAAPAPAADVFGAVTAVVGLIGQNWSAAGRDEFILLAAGELADLPGDLVMDALKRARRRVTDGRMLVSWVCDDVEPRAARLEAELKVMRTLAELAVA